MAHIHGTGLKKRNWNRAEPRPLLNKLGIAYNPADKYRGLHHANLGEPVMPENIKCC